LDEFSGWLDLADILAAVLIIAGLDLRSGWCCKVAQTSPSSGECSFLPINLMMMFGRAVAWQERLGIVDSPPIVRREIFSDYLLYGKSSLLVVMWYFSSS